MRKFIFLFTLFFFLAIPLIALAQTNVFPESISVAKDEVIEDNYIKAANSIDINGTINGDAILAGNTITINGNVQGDVIAAASIIKINGEVQGNVRVLGATVEINNKVGKNVNAFGSNLTLTENSSVGWSLLFGCSQIDINSPVAGKILGTAAKININNSVGTNVNVNLGEKGTLTVGSEAKIKGDLIYTGTKDALINSGGLIQGKTLHKPISAEITQAKKFLSRNWLLFRIIGLFGLLLVGVVIITLAKEKTRQINQEMWQQPVKTMLFGLLYLIVIPIILFLLIFTIIAGPLSLIGFCLYFIIIYLARIFTGTLIGQKILEYFGKKKLGPEQKEANLLWPMILGTTIIYILTSVPYLGWFFGLLAIIWALGGLGEMLKKKKVAENK